MTPEQRTANNARKPTQSYATKEWDKIFSAQYTGYGGYCGECGEACRPVYKRLPQDVIDSACPYNGDHPEPPKEPHSYGGGKK